MLTPGTAVSGVEITALLGAVISLGFGHSLNTRSAFVW